MDAFAAHLLTFTQALHCCGSIYKTTHNSLHKVLFVKARKYDY